MGENYANDARAQMGAARGLVAGSQLVSSREVTVAQNIDNRISSLMEQIERLQVVKAKLSKGTILDISLDDLQMAMGRY